MKHITKIIVAGAFAFAIMFGAAHSYAQEDVATIQNRIAELRETHKELKAQVQAGEITAEEARATWQDLVAKARAQKEAFFEARIERVEAKYQQLLENNPERAEIFKEHIDAARKRHGEIVAKRDELRAKVDSGEVTQQEANRMRIDFMKEQRNKFQEIRADVQAKRKKLRDSRPDTAVRPANGTRPVGANGAVRPVNRPNTGATPLPFDAINTLTTQ